MDRTAWIVVTLATLGLIASIFWQSQRAHETRVQLEKQGTVLPSTATPSPTSQPVPLPTAETTGTTLASAQQAPAQEEVLQGEALKLILSNVRGGVSRVELLQHKAEPHDHVALSNPTSPAIGAITQNPNSWEDRGYTVSSDETAGTATLRRTTAEGVEITKVFATQKPAGLADPYQFKFTITFKNNGTQDYTLPGYFVSSGAAQPIHASDQPIYTRFDWYTKGKYRTIDVNWFAPSNIPFTNIQTKASRDIYSESANDILWVGVTSQYFATILSPVDGKGAQVWARRIWLPQDNSRPSLAAIEGAVGLPGFALPPGQARTSEFVVYAGPKEYGRLAKLGNDQKDVMNFGMFGWISEILLTSMNTLHAWVGSYAFAIIILTIIIRSLLWPLQNAATKSMKRMAKLQPVMTELREKYKDDPQRMNQEVMKLYKEYGVNPFGGCLPILIQIPIFFGFYSMLGSAVELRNSSFLWVQDLSQPDTVFHLFGIPINILPLVMAGTMFWQMQITPKTGDPSTQRIFMIMPVVFIVLCYNYASALALYWTVQNLFMIVQIYLTRNQAEPELKKASPGTVIAKKRSYR
jgi:YidC/Oxa1 family membrane protein insertase